jgi:hypothetical protein
MFEKAVARWLGGRSPRPVKVHQNVTGSRMNVDLQRCVADRIQQVGTEPT